MTVQYTDLLEQLHNVRADGRTVSYAVITEETKDRFLDKMVTASAGETDTGDGIGTTMGFTVTIGDEHKLVTESGHQYRIET